MTVFSPTLFAVVGPAGAGKNSLIEGARTQLAGDGRFVFPRRFVTRPKQPGGEDFVSVSAPRFIDLRLTGALALWWEEAGFAWAIPATAVADVEAGKAVAVVMPHDMVPAARMTFPRVVVIEVTAPLSTLVNRLGACGRDDEDTIRHRLLTGEHPRIRPDALIVNDGTLISATAKFINVLRRETGPQAKVAAGREFTKP
jgi:phosphonate metabolism protein PhnN/1,5-bisphosphokinase (PRPP-forming)